MLRSLTSKSKIFHDYNPNPPPPIDFHTGLYNISIALNRTRNLFLVYGIYRSNRYRCYCFIFTINGDLVTSLSLGFDIKAINNISTPFTSFTDDGISVEIIGNRVCWLSDFGNGFTCFKGKVLDIDEDGNYYVFQLGLSQIHLVSPYEAKPFAQNFVFNNERNEHFVCKDKGQVFIFKFCRRIQTSNFSVNFSRPKIELKVYRYSRPTSQMSEKTYMVPTRYNRCCMDNSNNVIFDLFNSNKYCVCYNNGGVKVHQFQDEKKGKYLLSDGLLVTNYFQLIRIFEKGCKIYNLM